MDDLISRKALMKEFSAFVKASNNSDFAPAPTWNDAVLLVESMPSAQPEWKKGKWMLMRVKDDGHGNVTFQCFCSKCGEPAYEFFQPYCHHCGAYMKGESHDETH